jgi:serine/threonine protein kinase
MDRNQVDQGPWFDPDEITTRSQWEKIGDGSFGKVYKAHMLGTPVAIKVIQNLKPDRVNGLKRDMFYLQRLQHPNVVQVFGAFVEEGVLHMVMEFVPNSLRNKRVVNQVNIVRVLLDVARALVRMHAQGHIHRDVKARNVLISQVRSSSLLSLLLLSLLLFLLLLLLLLLSLLLLFSFLFVHRILYLICVFFCAFSRRRCARRRAFENQFKLYSCTYSRVQSSLVSRFVSHTSLARLLSPHS